MSEEKFIEIKNSNRAVAGFGNHGNDYQEKDISAILTRFLIPNAPATFYFWMKEDSMFPLIKRGDLIIVDRSLEVKNDDLVVVAYKGEHVLRRIYFKDVIYLRAENNKYAPVIVHQKEELEIFGIVTFNIQPHRFKNKKI